VMTDSEGREGGSSDIETVSLSNDASCLSANSPSSTASVPSSTTSKVTPTSSSASPTSSQSTSSGSTVAAVAGAVIGCLVALAVLVTLGMFLLRKRRASRSTYVMSSSNRQLRRLPSVDADRETNRYDHIPPIYPFPYQADSVSQIAPPIQPGTHSHQTSTGSYAVDPPIQPGTHSHQTSTGSYAVDPPTIPFSHSRQNSNNGSSVGYGEAGSSSMSSAGRRKAAMAGQTAYKNPTRFILHTDVDDVVPDDNGVVELPPQYSERRKPEPAQRPMSSHSVYSGPSDLAYADSAFDSLPSQSHSPPPS
jgi:hypothetical protein